MGRESPKRDEGAGEEGGRSDKERYVESVQNGDKPGASIHAGDVAQEDLHKWKSAGFEVLLSEQMQEYQIARKGKFQELIKNTDITRLLDLSGMADKLPPLISQMQDMSIAEALKFLTEYPRTNNTALGVENVEQMEVAILEGIAFGYKPCDIEYYVNIRYLGKEGYAEELGKEFSNQTTGAILCKDCASREIREQSV